MLTIQHQQNSLSLIYFERRSSIESFIVSDLGQNEKKGIIVDCERRIRSIADSQQIFIVDDVQNLMKVVLNIHKYLHNAEYLYVSGLITPLRPYMNTSFGVKSLAFLLSVLDELKDDALVLIKSYTNPLNETYPLYWDIFRRYTDNLFRIRQSGNHIQVDHVPVV